MEPLPITCTFTLHLGRWQAPSQMMDSEKETFHGQANLRFHIADAVVDELGDKDPDGYAELEQNVEGTTQVSRRHLRVI